MQDSKAIGGLVDLVDRQFTAPEPDQLWVGDITYIWTYSGFAYLATLIDMCSNKVVGWAVDDHMRTGLVLEAVDNALAARGPGIGIGELVVHHDRGPSIPRESTAIAFSPRVLSRRSGTPAYATTTRQRNRLMRRSRRS